MNAINDLEERKIVWLALSDLFLDTDVTLFYDNIVNKCASSKYPIEELTMILKDEVAPACSFNLYLVAGEWAGFDEDWLQNRIVKIIKNRARRISDANAEQNTIVRAVEGKRTIVGKMLEMIGASCLDTYLDEQWSVLSERIRAARGAV